MLVYSIFYYAMKSYFLLKINFKCKLKIIYYRKTILIILTVSIQEICRRQNEYLYGDK